MKRVDIHRPSAINPEAYDFVGYGATPEDGYLLNNHARIFEHMERTGGNWATHEHGGNCHVCGAHCIWTAVFYHPETNTYIHTGLDCAENLWNLDTAAFRRAGKSAVEFRTGKKKALVILEENDLMAAWDLYMAEWATLPKQPMRHGCTAEFLYYEEETIRSIVAGLVKYGNISDRQISFVKSLLAKIPARAAALAAREAAYAAAAPVPTVEGRTKVVGKVLSTRMDDGWGYNQSVYKMLVMTNDGYKLWGTVPAALGCPLENGTMVEFEATVEPSDKDPKFGFFKRPTKAARIETSALAIAA